MAEIICHNEGKYNIFSTIWDSFCFKSSITLDQLKQYTKDEYGELGLRSLDARLERAHSKGVSSLMGESSLKEFLVCNRAGEEEAELSYEECLVRFLS